MRRALVAAAVAITAIDALFPTAPADAIEVPGPVRLAPEDADSWIRLDAKFVSRPDVCPARQPRNLHAGYPGVVEIGRRADGRLYVVTELDFPRYLKGIAEVPRDWHIEALKAQVVAARTYAISHMNPSTAVARELNYNLCATDACQVYRGRNVERGAWGEAWQHAVDATGGEILEYQGKPASTFYYSTSNGRTYSNSDAFGGSPLPYLKPVTEADDTASPLSSWSIRMPLSDMTETLRRARSWTAGTIERISQEGSTIRLSGGGVSVSLSIERFRRSLNNQAVCLTPKRYPSIGSNGRPLPQVVPSEWMEVKQEGSDAVITGRGWGHGVGMVQWGLQGKADRGMSYADMLAFYYSGLRPVKKGQPGRIRIGLAIDVEEILIERVGRVRVEGPSIDAPKLRLRGGGSVNMTEGRSIDPLLSITNVATTGQPSPLAPVGITFEASGPANVKVVYRGPVEGESASEPKERGGQSIDWDTSALHPGTYEVTLSADDGVDTVSAAPLAIAIVAPPSPAPYPSPSAVARAQPEAGDGSLLRVAGSLILVALVAAGALLFIRRKFRLQR